MTTRVPGVWLLTVEPRRILPSVRTTIRWHGANLETRRDVVACGWLVLRVVIERTIGYDAFVDGGNRKADSHPLLRSPTLLRPRWFGRTIDRALEYST